MSAIRIRFGSPTLIITVVSGTPGAYLTTSAVLRNRFGICFFICPICDDTDATHYCWLRFVVPFDVHVESWNINGNSVMSYASGQRIGALHLLSNITLVLQFCTVTWRLMGFGCAPWLANRDFFPKVFQEFDPDIGFKSPLLGFFPVPRVCYQICTSSTNKSRPS